MNTTRQPDPQRYRAHFESIDNLIARVDKHRVEPKFSQKLHDRQHRSPDFDMSDTAVLQKFVNLIAYSNNAQARGVSTVINSGILAAILGNYDVQKASQVDPDAVIREHWQALKPLRFKYKVYDMVKCAQWLADPTNPFFGSFMSCLKAEGLPPRIQSEFDFEQFWIHFDRIRSHLFMSDMPYFGSFTSLCHLLMALGFDCAKPDSAVMKSAVDLGIVPPPPKQKKDPNKEKVHPEPQRRYVVQTMQAYGLSRGVRPTVVDLHFLIHGGQTGVTDLVDPRYYHQTL